MPDAVVRAKATAARASALQLATASDEARRAAVEAFADLLAERAAELEAANAKDVEVAATAVAHGDMTQAMADRLPLGGIKLFETIQAVRAVAAQADPIGRVLRATRLDDGLELRQVTVPIGVVACAFESRPDAAMQIASLCMRTGNAVLLKGGREATASNAALAAVARDALASVGLPADGVGLIESRTELQALLKLDDLVDLMIPRGSTSFVRLVMDRTRIPVLGHADGVCHVYIHASADADKARRIVVDSKTDYPAACNSMEALLVDRAVAPTMVAPLVEALEAGGVEVRVAKDAMEYAPGRPQATDDDRGAEFGDLRCAVFLVDGVGEAVAFINRHGSGHTDVIVAEDRTAAAAFTAAVDAAGVYVNASTRFADGYRYGLGAEVGISTGKVHARGPVGLDGLTTTKWILHGDGHIAATYQGDKARRFKHETMES